MNTPARSFQDLIVWQKGHELVLETYKKSANFPKEEVYGLTSQIMRDAYSVPANIAEGFKRKSNVDKLRFYNMAQTSLEEVRYCYILARDLNYLNDYETIVTKVEETARLLDAFIKSIERKQL